MRIIGGTYIERCFEPYWDSIYGSGLRACIALLEYDKEITIEFDTYVDKETGQYCQSVAEAYDHRLRIVARDIPVTPIFYYDHPLITPRISPRMDVILQYDLNRIDVTGENILLYGMLEGNAVVDGNKVVYDPQSPVQPIKFSNTSSKAKQLVYVINHKEAILLTGKQGPLQIRDAIYSEKNCCGLILKMAAKGALVFDEAKEAVIIPVYETNKVWPIGSGDIFSSIFAYNWFKGNSLSESAAIASKATAIYCNSKGLNFSEGLSEFSFKPLYVKEFPQKLVYLAGPFFTFAQRWLVNEMRSALRGMGLLVFSPFHDVGYGTAKDVAVKDLEALDKSGLVVAMTDGLDSGTIFEIGYAVAKKIPVIVFNQNESPEDLKMIEGSKCEIESDFTTAVYKAFWTLASE